MRKICLAVALLLALPAAAIPPSNVSIESSGTFDANRTYSATFTATGAINDQGSLIDAALFTGAAIHFMRTMTTSDGVIVLEINADHVSGSQVVPSWCAPPATIPSGTLLFPERGVWRVLYGTGQYASLGGTGTWAAWVVVDPALGPVSAIDCLEGKVKLD